MKYIFIVGVGRSGTTFLKKILSFTTTKAKVVREPLSRANIVEGHEEYNEPWTVLPNSKKSRKKEALDVFLSLTTSNSLIRKDIVNETVTRNEIKPDCIIVKEIHALMEFPVLLKEIDYRVVLVSRNTSRIVDSYFRGHKKKYRKYLVDDFNYIRRILLNEETSGMSYLLKETLDSLPVKMTNYFKRRKILTTELMRFACIVEFYQRFFAGWSTVDDRVMLLSYEKLCSFLSPDFNDLFKFCGLGYDGNVFKKIYEIMHGKNEGYYATDKNSKLILNKPYSYLSQKDVAKINNLIR